MAATTVFLKKNFYLGDVFLSVFLVLDLGMPFSRLQTFPYSLDDFAD